MSEKISDQLKADFGFEGVLGGPEYEALPKWKQVTADALIVKGMEYRITKSHLEMSTSKVAQYAKEVEKFSSGKTQALPLYAKFSDLEEWVLIYEMVRENIRMLIKIYNSGTE